MQATCLLPDPIYLSYCSKEHLLKSHAVWLAQNHQHLDSKWPNGLSPKQVALSDKHPSCVPQYSLGKEDRPVQHARNQIWSLVSTFGFAELYKPAHFFVFLSSPILHLFRVMNLRPHQKKVLVFKMFKTILMHYPNPAQDRFEQSCFKEGKNCFSRFVVGTTGIVACNTYEENASQILREIFLTAIAVKHENRLFRLSRGHLFLLAWTS